jgi:hypothetical protein
MENSFTVEKLDEIKKDIESMEKYHQIEILRIMVNSKTKINENRSGVFVNLSFLDDAVLGKIAEYVNYVKEQTTSLNEVEKKKEQYKSTFFSSGGAGAAAAAGAAEMQKRVVNLFS